MKPASKTTLILAMTAFVLADSLILSMATVYLIRAIVLPQIASQSSF